MAHNWQYEIKSFTQNISIFLFAEENTHISFSPYMSLKHVRLHFTSSSQLNFRIDEYHL